jgi:hypothetical protein
VTDYKLGRLYAAARNAAQLADDPLAFPRVRAKAERQIRQAYDVMAMGIDDRQAAMLDWARENGYPDWETVLRYNRG